MKDHDVVELIKFYNKNHENLILDYVHDIYQTDDLFKIILKPNYELLEYKNYSKIYHKILNKFFNKRQLDILPLQLTFYFLYDVEKFISIQILFFDHTYNHLIIEVDNFSVDMCGELMVFLPKVFEYNKSIIETYDTNSDKTLSILLKPCINKLL